LDFGRGPPGHQREVLALFANGAPGRPILSHEEDHGLIRQVAAGDRSAFATLVERHRRSLYRFILRQVGRPAVADELLQEVFLRAYRGAGSYEPRAALATWLFRIAANLCLNEVQAARSRREVIGDVPEGALRLPNTAEELERKQVSAAVEAALGRLPPEQRAAVQLARFEGMSYQEIAEVLSVGAVGRALRRAAAAGSHCPGARDRP
jgi:RNA polymerase sigma-70 factor (ECF subfamily)